MAKPEARQAARQLRQQQGLSIKEIAVDKIYITDDRSFGMDLDYKRKRYKYYMKTWRYAHFKYFKKQLSPL